MWRFLHDPAVEPTNSHGERELRGLVTWRKSSVGSQSDNVLAYLTTSFRLRSATGYPPPPGGGGGGFRVSQGTCAPTYSAKSNPCWDSVRS